MLGWFLMCDDGEADTGLKVFHQIHYLVQLASAVVFEVASFILYSLR